MNSRIITLFIFTALLTIHTYIIAKSYRTLSIKIHPVVYYHPNDPSISNCYRATGKIDWERSHKSLKDIVSDKTIFFLDTSCKGGLDSREICAVESAARAHPEWLIVVFFLGRLQKDFLSSPSFKVLKQYTNVQLLKLRFVTHTDKTLYPLVNSTCLSDWLRFFILKEHGGVFLDLDMIITNSFKKFSNNWVASQSPSVLEAGAMRLSNDELGRKIVSLSCEIIQKQNKTTVNLDKKTVITSALQQICLTKNVTDMKAAASCQGFEFLEPFYFYLIDRTGWHYYLQPGCSLSILDTHFAYAHKTWSSLSLGTIFGPNTKLALLAEKYCPNAYYLYEDHFGL